MAGSAARSPDGECLAEGGLPLGESVGAVERLVDRRRRLLLRLCRQHEEDPVVGRKVERLQLAPVAGSELRPFGQEERNVGADPGRDLVQTLDRERRRKRLVGQPQRGRRVGAPAAEPGADRDPLLDLDRPARLDARRFGQRQQRVADERVVRKAGDLEAGSRRERDPVGEVDPLEHRRHLVLSVRAAAGRRRARG